MKSNIHHGFEKQKSYYYIWYSEIMQRDVISLTVDPFYRLIILIYCWYNFFLQQETQHLIIFKKHIRLCTLWLFCYLSSTQAAQSWCVILKVYVQFTVFNISTAIWLVGILAFNVFFFFTFTNFWCHTPGLGCLWAQ